MHPEAKSENREWTKSKWKNIEKLTKKPTNFLWKMKSDFFKRTIVLFIFIAKLKFSLKSRFWLLEALINQLGNK